MLTAAIFPGHCQLLLNPGTLPEKRKELVTEIRDSIELVHTQEYSAFVANFLPAFQSVLSTVTKPQATDNVVHQTRAIILEILSRLPHNEVLRGKFQDISTIAMDVLQNDNEDNAVTAIRIIFDLHKNYRHHLSGHVQPFLDFVRRSYESFRTTVNSLLLTKRQPDVQVQPAGRWVPSSGNSFKVMTECPLLVMFVFQLYPAFIKSNIQHLLPLMVRAIECEVPGHAVSWSPKTTFQEFIAAQVKTLSFLAYLLRQFPDFMKSDEMSIPRSVVKLLESCPSDSILIRKELLTATRHILGSPFRQGFFGQIDLLLEPRILVGSGKGAADALRPLAYSFLAELVHCVRCDLKIPQLEKVIFIFSTNLHDPSFNYTLQTSAVRLLLNLMEGIMKIFKEDPSKRKETRELLLRILETMVEKYETLGAKVPELLESVERLRRKADPAATRQRLCDIPVGDPLKEIVDFKALLKTLTLGLKTVIWSAINIGQQSGLSKGSSSATKSDKPSAAPQSRQVQSTRVGLSEKECEIISRLLDAGQKCFRLYSVADENRDGGQVKPSDSDSLDESSKNTKAAIDYSTAAREHVYEDLSYRAIATAQEQRDTLDQFAHVFTVLDVRSFQDVFGLRMGQLFNHCVENPAASTIAQLFLTTSTISKYFADILLSFLVENLSIFDVAIPHSGTAVSKEQKVAATLLKLFKILFASVSLFPTNEPILRLHVGAIVRRCLKYAARARDPHNYLQMLRALFKTVTNSKSETQFELLYRDFMPLVEPLFTGLLALYQGPNRFAHSELIVELCLMVPARPSTIFPYLDLQIRPMVWALQGGRDNVHYGLRALEFWVDMLQPSYLDSLLSRVDPELTRALFRLLRPPSSVQYGPIALRILGKLGSRARSDDVQKPSSSGRDMSTTGQQMRLIWPDGNELSMTTDALIYRSADTLLDDGLSSPKQTSVEHKQHAWKFLYICLGPFLGIEGFETDRNTNNPQSESTTIVWEFRNAPSAERIQEDMSIGTSRHTSRTKGAAECGLVKAILISLIASSDALDRNDVQTHECGDVNDFGRFTDKVSDIARFFAFLTVRRYERGKVLSETIHEKSEPGASTPSGSEGFLRDSIFLDALTTVLSEEERTFSSSGLACLKAFISGLCKYCTRERNISRKRSIEDPSPDSRAVGATKKELLSQHSHGSAEVVQRCSHTERAPSSLNCVGPRGDKMDTDLVASDTSGVVPRASPEIFESKGVGITSDAGAAGTVKNNQFASLEYEVIFMTSLTGIVDRLCHCCYQRRWGAKWAGARGLGMIIAEVPAKTLGSTRFASLHILIIRALLYVVKDSIEASEDEVVECAQDSLCKLLGICFAAKSLDDLKAGTPKSTSSKVFRETTVRLTMYIASESDNARETARKCLRTLATILKCDVVDILVHVKEQLLRPLQQRSIRRNPLPVQIGYMEAIIFCLQMKRPLLDVEMFSPPMRSFMLSEVITISEDPTIEKLTEAEEGIRHRLVENKLIQSSVVKHLVSLRRNAVSLLCHVAVHRPDRLEDPSNDDLFRRMISSFFKNLQSRDTHIVDSAKRGLKQAIAKHQRPKELLQQNLRPILGNLADYKKLSIPYLQALSRVLELFSHCFNVSLGEKLLEHLQRWTEPEKLAELKRWTPGTEARVGAAILDLFHLLPPAASKFLEKIVHMVIRLEAVLAVAGPGVAHLGLKGANAASTSPYREPLLKYCNKHAAVAARFFLLNIEDDVMRQLFFVMVRAEDSKALRIELMSNPKRLVSPTYLSVEAAGSRSLHAISLINLLSVHEAKWLGQDPDLISRLSGYWKSLSGGSDMLQQHSSSLGKVREVKTMADVFIRYCSNFPKETDVLFDLLPVFSATTCCDFTFVKNFLKDSVTKPEWIGGRRAVLLKFMSMFQDKSVPQERKVHALQYIVTPMTEYHLSERQKRIEREAGCSPDSKVSEDAETSVAKTHYPGKSNVLKSEKEHGAEITPSKVNHGSSKQPSEKPEKGFPLASETLSEKVSKGHSHKKSGTGLRDAAESKDAIVVSPPDAVFNRLVIQRIMKDLLDQPNEVLRNYDEVLSAELLRLATLLIQYMPTELGRHRQELIKFGWNHLKREDSIAKQWALVNVSRFFEAYKAPTKIILQVYAALLRACQGDGRELVQDALDILTPALPLRLVHNPNDHKYPIWIRYTKKILLEEGHTTPNLVHILQLIARHSDLFYVARAQYVPIMVNSLPRIGLSSTTGAEYRRLALDLVDLITKWEQRRRANSELDHGQGEDDASFKGIGKRPREEIPATDTLPGDSGKEESHLEVQDGGGEPPAKMRKSSNSQVIPASPMPNQSNTAATNRKAEEFKPNSAMVEALVNCLVQIPFRPMDRREGPLITKRCMVLLKEALELWPDAIVRMSFIEKLLTMPSGDKPASASPALSKGTSNTGSKDAMEPKVGSKIENQQSDKAELARSKRAASRFASLKIALDICLVLASCQRRSFIEANSEAIRALTAPSLSENSVPLAKQFASLLDELLKGRTSSEPDEKEENNDSQAVKQPQKASKTNIAITAVDSSEYNSGSQKTKNEPSMQVIPSGGQEAGRLADRVYGYVRDSIVVCLTSPDPIRNYCGLLVLEVISKHMSHEFRKHQELLSKTLHRMTRENLSPNQHSSGGGNSNSTAGGGAGGNNRAGHTSDRSGVNSSASVQKRVSTDSATHSAPNPSADGALGGKASGGEDGSPQKKIGTQALILCLSLLGNNIMTLESGQKKTLFQLLWALIDRCLQVEILLEIVSVVGKWVLWKPLKEVGIGSLKEPLSSKEKVQFLLKMVVFERIQGKGAQNLMRAYLEIILKIFGGKDRRPELLPKLEKAFMLGMKTKEPGFRERFFHLYHESVGMSLLFRLNFIVAKQDWEYLNNQFWISHAAELILAACDKSRPLECVDQTATFCELKHGKSNRQNPSGPAVPTLTTSMEIGDGNRCVLDESLKQFCMFHSSLTIGSLIAPMRALLYCDKELAYDTWTSLFPRVWSLAGSQDRLSLEKAIPVLLTKEYHQMQVSWPRNNIQALLESFSRCNPLPPLRADLVFHLGSRWNAWYTALQYLNKRACQLRARNEAADVGLDPKGQQKVLAELETIADAEAALYRLLGERDYLCGSWKERACASHTRKALTLEQLGQYGYAQDVYTDSITQHLSSSEASSLWKANQISGTGYSDVVTTQPGKSEVCFWEERWIECARKLCQWDVLTEFSRVVLNSELLHECLWRVPDWSALKELLIKNPVEDGPRLKLYQAYVQLQENKLELAESFIMQGYKKALERYCSLPESADLDSSLAILVQFQQFVELQESGRILGELNALSRHGSGSINVEQKIDTVRHVLNTWRERLPAQHEPLDIWNDILTWRNHVHAVVVNVLEALKEAASAKVAAAQNSSGATPVANRSRNSGVGTQTPQVQAAAAIAQALPQQVLVMGVNETAWNVHRFAKTCRKQGSPSMALYALQKLYPFGTMELSEYFVKTKETARSFMARPKNLSRSTEYGLHELNRCNMDHFNARQKAQLFTIRGKICESLERENDAVEAFSVALTTSSDVGSAWLAWGLHCDKVQTKISRKIVDDETAANTTEKHLQYESYKTNFEASLRWREAAANCYMQAVKFGSRSGRNYLSRVLRLLSDDVHARSLNNQHRVVQGEETAIRVDLTGRDAQRGSASQLEVAGSNQNPNAAPQLKATEGRGVGQNQQNDETSADSDKGVAHVVTRLAADIPPWMWLPWISQMVAMLAKAEAFITQSLLLRVAHQYPQALFFPLRSFMEERNIIDKPERNLTKEALKMSRPISPVLLSNAPTPQANLARQAQTAKENAQRAQQRIGFIQKGMQRLVTVISGSQGTTEHAAHLARQRQLKEELAHAHHTFERYAREYQILHAKQKQLSESMMSGPTIGGLQSSQARKHSESSVGSQHSNEPSHQTFDVAVSEKKKVDSSVSGTDGKADVNAVKKGMSDGVKSASENQREGVISTNQSSEFVPRRPFSFADSIMAQIVKSHQHLYEDIEKIVLDFAFKFKLQREEHLLSVMNALLHRCYQIPVKPGTEVAQSFRNALEELSKMCFGTGSETGRESNADSNVHSRLADLKVAFEAELAPQTSKDFPTQLEAFIERLKRWQGIFQRRVDAMPEFLKLEDISRLLTETKESDVEVFGQYLEADGSEPIPDSQVRIHNFSVDVRVVRRATGPARGIQMTGTDGHQYNYILETSVNPVVQASEERISHIYRLLNSRVFAKDAEAHRRRISLAVPVFLPTGARTRLVSDRPEFSSLAQGFDHYLAHDRKSFDDPLVAFRTYASEAYGRRRVGSTEVASRAKSISARVEAYHKVCKAHVPDTCLAQWVRSRIYTAAGQFMFRKRFSETVAVASLLSYALAIGSRRPQNIMLACSTGTTYNAHLRGLISSRGVLECGEAVPFRLTRNMTQAMGPFGLDGPYFGCMAAGLQALLRNEELIRLLLSTVLRDELTGWVTSRSEQLRAKMSAGITRRLVGTAGNEYAVIDDRLARSVDAVIGRLKLRAPTDDRDRDVERPSKEGGESELHVGVVETVRLLIEKAREPLNLAQMDPGWLAWY